MSEDFVAKQHCWDNSPDNTVRRSSHKLTVAEDSPSVSSTDPTSFCLEAIEAACILMALSEDNKERDMPQAIHGEDNGEINDEDILDGPVPQDMLPFDASFEKGKQRPCQIWIPIDRYGGMGRVMCPFVVDYNKSADIISINKWRVERVRRACRRLIDEEKRAKRVEADTAAADRHVKDEGKRADRAKAATADAEHKIEQEEGTEEEENDAEDDEDCWDPYDNGFHGGSGH